MIDGETAPATLLDQRSLESLQQDAYSKLDTLRELQEKLQTEPIPFIMTQGGDILAIGDTVTHIIADLQSNFAESPHALVALKKDLSNTVSFLPARFIMPYLPMNGIDDTTGNQMIIVAKALATHLPVPPRDIPHVHNGSTDQDKLLFLAATFERGKERATDRMQTEKYRRSSDIHSTQDR